MSDTPLSSHSPSTSTAVQASLEQQLQAQMMLQPLREDLTLHQGATQKDGAPSWVIEDPMRGRFFRIGWLEFEVLQRWHLGNAGQVAQSVSKETLMAPSIEEVLAIKQFFLRHELLVDKTRLKQISQGPKPRSNLASMALHNYLMVRIPLINPDQLLERFLPWFSPLLGRRALNISMGAALLGLLLALQQWDTFTSTLLETLSVEGLLSYSFALVMAKVLHELGHAFTAKKLGLRVPRMGVAIVLLLPMLYTDTSETWRLTRKRDRFAIAAAGMRIELMLAAWCTLAWAFLPDGALRGAMFFLATTSWIMTLAVNASPFMRFDGYYMMSDATGIPNLHDAASSVAKHALRKHLLGFKAPEPSLEGEAPPPWLAWFGLTTMIYRFFLFMGIAVTVYHYFFKALGIFLFAVELWWFIFKPIHAELKNWWADRRNIQRTPLTRVSVALLGLMLVLVVPWQSQIQAEGWLHSGHEFAVYSPRPARLLTLPQAGAIQLNRPLVTLDSSDLLLRQARANAKINGLDHRLLAATGSDQLMESVRSTREQIAQQWTELEGAGSESRQLRMTSPFPGFVVDVAKDLMIGSVVARQDVLARVINPDHWIAEVLVDEDAVKRIFIGAEVRAYMHGVHMEIIDGHVDEIDTVPVDQLPTEMLAARYGGYFITTDDPNQLKPRHALYRVRVLMQHGPKTQQARLASFNIHGQRTSLIDRMARGVMSALVLQTSF
jgi:putative peptide zinc metalloprotease protein